MSTGQPSPHDPAPAGTPLPHGQAGGAGNGGQQGNGSEKGHRGKDGDGGKDGTAAHAAAPAAEGNANAIQGSGGNVQDHRSVTRDSGSTQDNGGTRRNNEDGTAAHAAAPAAEGNANAIQGSGGNNPQGDSPRRNRVLLWRLLAVLAVVIVVLALLAPWWGRPILKNAVKSALLADGWQTVELSVTSLGLSQAKLGDITLERPEAKVEIPEVSLTYSLSDLLLRKRVQGVIASRARLEARWATNAADLVGAPLIADWPRSDRLPFERIYVSDAEIVTRPEAGLQGVRLNAMLEHTAPQGRSGGRARIWASAQSLWPYAQLDVSVDADLRNQTLKATLEGEFRDLNQWRQTPLPPEAQTMLEIVREKLSLQGAASVSKRSVQNWMLFGQSPAAVYTAPNGIHAEGLGVDFGVNVIGTDRLDYSWVRSASGAAQSPDGNIEWNNLWAEFKPGEYLNAHIGSATLRAEVSSIARELMPSIRFSNELSNLWRTQAWQAKELSLNLFAPEPAKNRPPFMRMGGQLKLGSFEYPWEKLQPLTPQMQSQLREYPLLDTLTAPIPKDAE